MKEFMGNKMNNIFEDFKDELDNMGNCCILKELRYNNGNIPDYSLSIIQQLYLLRYLPAYLTEYYSIYQSLIDQEFIDEYKVLSIGSGCGLDYYGLYFALKNKSEKSVEDICYTGVDIIDWNYRDDLGNEYIYFINEDITAWTELDWNKYNIIMFPKSIGEFSDEDFEYLLNVFRNSEFDSDKIFLVSSVREKNDEIDIARLEKLINIFENEHNFKCLDDKSSYTCFKENVGLARYFSDFNYPNNIKEFIAKLMDKCGVYENNWFESCEQNCATLLNKYPILKTGHIKYQVKRLERE